MKLLWKIAWRYVFSRRKVNAINIITGISIFGIAISTAAMVIVMSAFNGIEDLVQQMYGASDPDIRITAAKGKWMEPDDNVRNIILSTQGVAALSAYIEEIVILQNRDQWMLGRMKGVEETYLDVADIGEHVIEGSEDYNVFGGTAPGVLAGLAIVNRIGVYMDSDDDSFSRVVKVFGLKGHSRLSSAREKAVNEGHVSIVGVFQINPKFDELLIAPIDFAANLFGANNAISGYEIRVTDPKNAEKVRNELQAQLGDKFLVKTRYEQNELMYNTNKSEKKITVLVLVFIFLLSCFNLIAVLAMMILEKRRDMDILSALGLTRSGLMRIFIWQGVHITVIGAVTGVLLGLGICVLQQQTGFISMEGSVVDAYPVLLKPADFLLILAVVFGSGIMFSFGPVWALMRRSA